MWRKSQWLSSQELLAAVRDGLGWVDQGKIIAWGGCRRAAASRAEQTNVPKADRRRPYAARERSGAVFGSHEHPHDVI
jgi:hypothetical protein